MYERIVSGSSRCAPLTVTEEMVTGAATGGTEAGRRTARFGHAIHCRIASRH
jgi:hypothetical protein